MNTFSFRYKQLCTIVLTIVSPLMLLGCDRGTDLPQAENPKVNASIWVTDPKAEILFSKQDHFLKMNSGFIPTDTIQIDTLKKYQGIDGFGYCLTGGSARLLNEMEAGKRKQLLDELFSTEGNGIGVSYLRVSIGASDLSDSVFTYNDLPQGQTDVMMERFSIDVEKVHLIPILKEILAINPEILIMGSPWTPPVWMKTNNNSKGGSLKPEYYDAYARYFAQYIKAMKAEGIRIDAITVQNEPLHPGNNPSLLMLANEQAQFIKKSLGPMFKKEGIDTKIVVYDHNADRIDYPLTILNDPEAAQYVDGSAFHLYGGKISALSEVHAAHPNKHLYFTEQWVGAPGNLAGDLMWHTRNLIIGATRNWCRNVLEWNLAADPRLKPHTPGGCTQCLGAITIDGNNITRNPAYYIIAHAAKFVRPGAVRIESNLVSDLENVAFQNSDGSQVLVIANSSNETKVFCINSSNEKITAIINAGTVATVIIK